MVRLQIDPNVQVMWASPTELRFGFDSPRLVLNNPSQQTQRLIDALRIGMPTERFGQIASAYGVGVREQVTLLERLSPVLIDEETASGSPLAGVRVHLLGEKSLPIDAKTLVESAGGVITPNTRPDVTLVFAHFVCSPARVRPLTTRGIPHLPIIFGETSVVLGPFAGVEQNPCLFCVDLAHTDSDPSWPAIASQMLGRTSPICSSETVAVSIGLAMGLIHRWRSGVNPLDRAQLRISEDIERGIRSTREPVMSHPGCGCQTFASRPLDPVR